MLDAYIIEEIKRREEKKESERPRAPSPVPIDIPKVPKKDNFDPIIIPLYDPNKEENGSIIIPMYEVKKYSI